MKLEEVINLLRNEGDAKEGNNNEDNEEEKKLVMVIKSLDSLKAVIERKPQ